MPKLCAHRRTGGASCCCGVRGGAGLSAVGDSGCLDDAGDEAAAERFGTDLEVDGGALRGDLLFRC